MPAPDSLDNIRDFIACTAHGILIGAIPADRCSQLPYAAQVALGLQQFQAKASSEFKKRGTHPLPPKNSPARSRNQVVSYFAIRSPVGE